MSSRHCGFDSRTRRTFKVVFSLLKVKRDYISYIAGSMLKRINKPDEKDFFTVDEAARELGIKTTAIRNYLYEEKMTTYKFKTLTLISRKEVEDWKDRQK